MIATRVAKLLGMVGALIVVAALVRTQTLRSVIIKWDDEAMQFFRKDVYVGESDSPENVKAAICFARVTDRIIQNRVLSHYGDSCGDVGDKRLTALVAIGGVLLISSKLIQLVASMKFRGGQESREPSNETKGPGFSE